MSRKKQNQSQDLFAELYGLINNESLVQLLKEVEITVNSIESDSSSANLETLGRQWEIFSDTFQIFLRSGPLYSATIQLRYHLQTIEGIFKKFAAKNVIPSDPVHTYYQQAEDFREQLNFLKRQINMKKFTEDLYQNSLKFASDMNDTYVPAFKNANIDKTAKQKMIDTMLQAVNDFSAMIVDINDNTPIPNEYVELDDYIAELLRQSPSPRKNKKHKQPVIEEEDDDEEEQELEQELEPEPEPEPEPEQEEELELDLDFNGEEEEEDLNQEEEEEEEEIQEATPNDIHSEEELETFHQSQNDNFSRSGSDSTSSTSVAQELASIARTIESAAQTAKEPNHSTLVSLSKQLNDIADGNFFQDMDKDKEHLALELQRNRDMIQLLNKSQAMRTNLSIEALSKLNCNQLIAVIQSLITNQGITVPIEMTVAKGSPAEFRELGQKYTELLKYSDKANIEIQRMNLALVQLKNENQRMKIQLNQYSNTAALHNELESINQRTLQIENVLLTDPDHSNVRELNSEIDDLNRRREEIEAEFLQLDDGETELQIELLKKENLDLRKMCEERISENEQLKNQLVESAKNAAAQKRKAKIEIKKAKSRATIPLLQATMLTPPQSPPPEPQTKKAAPKQNNKPPAKKAANQKVTNNAKQAPKNFAAKTSRALNEAPLRQSPIRGSTNNVNNPKKNAATSRARTPPARTKSFNQQSEYKQVHQVTPPWKPAVPTANRRWTETRPPFR